MSSIITLILLAATVLATPIVPTTEKVARADTITAAGNSVASAAMLDSICMTTSQSPMTADIKSSADQLISWPHMCVQTESPGLGCTGMAISNGAAIEICGPQGWGIPCSTAGQYAMNIRNDCAITYGLFPRAGGTMVHTDGRGWVEVKHVNV